MTKCMIHDRAWVEVRKLGDEWVAGLFLELDDVEPGIFLCRLQLTERDASEESLAVEGAESWARVFRMVVDEARPDLDPQVEAELERQRELTDRLEKILSNAEGGT